MKDPNDVDTEDWVEQTASALKNEKGELQVPLHPQNMLRCVLLHCEVKDRNPVNLIEDICQATGFWLQDHAMRQQAPAPEKVPYHRGLNS